MEWRPWRWGAPKRKSLTITDGDVTTVANLATLTAAEQIVGAGTWLSVLMAPLLWLARNVSTIALCIKNQDGEEVDLPDLLALVTPRIMYSAAIDLALYGNVYIEIERGSMGQPVMLRYHPPTAVAPRVRAGTIDEIAYYEIRRSPLTGSVTGYGAARRVDAWGNQSAGAVVRRIPPDDMLHVANGIDPHYPVLGYSPLLALLMDAVADVEAGAAVASVLRNQGMIGLFVSPKGGDEGGAGVFDESQAKAVQENMEKRFAGAGRGKTMVTALPIDVKATVAELDKLAMQVVRGISEERVTAVLGIPAAVVGLGVGLRQTKVGATMRELRGVAWENAVLPCLDTILMGLTKMVAMAWGDDVRFGYRLPEGHVSAVNAEVLAKRAVMLKQAGIITVNEAREKVGEEPIDGGDDLMLPSQGGQASGE